MNSRSKRVLIVSQTFPPYQGVGGRRWAKFAKYLIRAGVDVHVVCADLNGPTNSPWSGDVGDIPLFTYRHRFPTAVAGNPSGFFEKLIYRLWLGYLKLVSKGSPYDRALLDRGSFYQTFVNQMDDFKPDVVIATGAPFRLLAYLSDLIDAFPETRFIADIRDPWTWGQSYGYANLHGKRLEFEKNLEKKVISGFHITTSPWPQIVSKLRGMYVDSSHKIELLPHGFDPDDFPERGAPQKSEKVNLVFGGNVYHGMEAQINQVAAYVQKQAHRFKLEIYSGNLDKISQKGNALEKNPPLPAAQFFKEASCADAILFLIPKHLKDGVPTKLYEYAYLGRPIVMMGWRGKVSELVEEKGLGIFIEEASELGEIDFEQFYVDRDTSWLENYRYDRVTDQLLNLVNRIEIS